MNFSYSESRLEGVRDATRLLVNALAFLGPLRLFCKRAPASYVRRKKHLLVRATVGGGEIVLWEGQQVQGGRIFDF